MRLSESDRWEIDQEDQELDINDQIWNLDRQKIQTKIHGYARFILLHLRNGFVQSWFIGL